MTGSVSRARPSPLPVLVGALLLWAAGALVLGALGAAALPAALAAVGLAAALALVVVARPGARHVMVGAGLLLVFVLYTSISDAGISYHGLPSIAQPFVFLMGVATFARRTMARGARGLGAQAGLWCAMGLYAVVLLASTIWAPDGDAAVRQATDLLKNLLIVYILVETFDTPGALRGAIWAMVTAGAVLAALSLLQAVTHNYASDFWGLAQAPVRAVTLGANDHRAAGPVGDPNFYALILAALVPLALGRLRDERHVALRAAATVAALMLVAALILTYSRGGLVALVVGVVLFIALAPIRPLRVLAALVVLLPLIAFVPGSYWERAAALVGGGATTHVKTDPSLQHREDAVTVALAIFADHPLAGVGADNYPAVYFPYALRLNVPGAASRSHDLYLQVAAETGLLGLGSFGAVLALALGGAWRRRATARATRDRAGHGMITATGLALVTYLVGSVFLPAAYPRYLWMLIGLVMAACVLPPAVGAARRSRAKVAPLPAPAPARPVPAVSMAITPASAPRSARPMSFGRQALRGGILSYGSFLASKALVYVSTLVLARLLSPRDFGIVGYALVVISFLDVAKDLGVTAALIYRQDMRDEEAGEALALNVLSGLLFFGLCWLVAPSAALFFHDPRVAGLTRVLGLSFVFAGVGGIPAALLQKRMRFGRGFLPDLTLSIAKGLVSVVLALGGAGYWSLVWGQLAGVAAAAATSLLLLGRVPRPHVRWASARRLLGYGLHITAVNLVGIVINNGDYAIVGRALGSTALGLYTLAYTLPQMLTISLSVAISRVVFPAYARIQGDRAALRRGYLAVLRATGSLLVPIGLGLAAVAPAVVHVLYRHSWWPAVPAMEALSLYAAIYALGWNAGDVYKAIGRPDVQWKLGIGHALVLVPALAVGAHMRGIEGVALAQIAVVVPYSLVRFYIIHRLLDIGAGAIVGALRVPLVAGAVLLSACALVAAVSHVYSPVTVLLLQVTLGGTAYVGATLALDPALRQRARQVAASLAGSRYAAMSDPAAH